MIIPITLDEFYTGFVHGDGVKRGKGFRAGWRTMKDWFCNIPEIIRREW